MKSGKKKEIVKIRSVRDYLDICHGFYIGDGSPFSMERKNERKVSVA